MSNGKKRNKENWTPHCHKICQNCGNACYIGEGDTACMAEEPRIVLDDWNTTSDYMWCLGDKWVAAYE